MKRADTPLARGFVLLVASLLVMPAAVSAHTLFLKPDPVQVEAGQTVTVSLRNGTFWQGESVVRRNQLSDLTISDPAGQTSALDRDSWRVEGKDAMVDFTLGENGTYVLGAATRPAVVRLPAEDFNLYLRYEGLKDQREDRDQRGESDTAVAERYTKFAKAVVQVGPAATDALQKRLGHQVEIIPLVDPGSLQPGDTFRARVLLEGQPLAGERVFASSANAQVTMPQSGLLERIEVISDADGQVEFEITDTGLWYVRFIRLERLGDSEYWYSDLLAWLGLQEPRVPYESLWATLTFRVP